MIKKFSLDGCVMPKIKRGKTTIIKIIVFKCKDKEVFFKISNKAKESTKRNKANPKSINPSNLPVVL